MMRLGLGGEGKVCVEGMRADKAPLFRECGVTAESTTTDEQQEGFRGARVTARSASASPRDTHSQARHDLHSSSLCGA